MVRALLWLTATSTLFLVAATLAQPARGSVAGRVLDTSEAVLPGVSVTLLPEGMGDMAHTIADDRGRYRLDDVPAGTYRIDFNLNGFDAARVNHVKVEPGATANVDAWLRVGVLCDCLRAHGTPVAFVDPPAAPPPIQGQVVDAAGRALPYATVEVVTEKGRQTAYTDREGSFRVRPPDGVWSITAFDSGFEPVTREVSEATNELLVFRLPYAGTTDLAEPRSRRTCSCLGDLFVHEQR